MPFAIPAGHKFSLLTFAGDHAHEELADVLELEAGIFCSRGAPPVPLDETWSKWLGSIAAEVYSKSQFSLVASRESATLGVVDGEHQQLEMRLSTLHYGFALLGALRSGEGEFRINGDQLQGSVDVRQVARPQPFHQLPRFRAAEVTPQIAARALSLGKAIEALYGIGPVPTTDPDTKTSTPDHIRVRRGFNELLEGLRAASPNRRLHHFVRALDGILRCPQGSAKKKFVHRGSMLIGGSPEAQELLTEIYVLRSAEEHLNDWQPVVQADAIAMLRAVQAECLACDLYVAILDSQVFLSEFVSDPQAEAFWDGKDEDVRARVLAAVPKQFRITKAQLTQDRRLWSLIG